MSMPFKTVHYFLADLQNSAVPDWLKVDTLATAYTMLENMYTKNSILHFKPCCLFRPLSASNLIFSRQHVKGDSENLAFSCPSSKGSAATAATRIDGSAFVYSWTYMEQQSVPPNPNPSPNPNAHL